MRHLAARFVKTAGQVVHVVDPYLDLRTIFRDAEKLVKNITARGLNINVQTTAEGYSNWWDAYSAFSLNENTDNRRNLRDKVLTRESGLLDALRLPNSLLPDLPFETGSITNKFKGLKETLDVEFDSSTLSHYLSNKLHNFALSELDPPALALAPPYMVRAAIVETCNMDCEDFPIVNDGTDNPRLVLTGISLPSAVACFLSHCLTESKERRLPLCFSSFGVAYSRNKVAVSDNPFLQRQVYNMLCIFPIDDQKCIKEWVSQIQTFLSGLFDSLGIDIECYQVMPPNLLLCEGSATVFNALNPNDSQNKLEVARISNLGDYVSRRANIKIEKKSKMGFAQMIYFQVDLSNIVSLLTNKRV